MTSAGDLKHKIGFFKRPTVSDGFGNEEGDFPASPNVTVHGQIQARFSGETVISDRLQGQQTVTITVRRSSLTLDINPAWKAKDLGTGVEYNIRSGPVDPDEKRQWLEFLCQSGIAT